MVLMKHQAGNIQLVKLHLFHFHSKISGGTPFELPSQHSFSLVHPFNAYELQWLIQLTGIRQVLKLEQAY